MSIYLLMFYSACALAVATSVMFYFMRSIKSLLVYAGFIASDPVVHGYSLDTANDLENSAIVGIPSQAIISDDADVNEPTDSRQIIEIYPKPIHLRAHHVNQLRAATYSLLALGELSSVNRLLDCLVERFGPLLAGRLFLRQFSSREKVQDELPVRQLFANSQSSEEFRELQCRIFGYMHSDVRLASEIIIKLEVEELSEHPLIYDWLLNDQSPSDFIASMKGVVGINSARQVCAEIIGEILSPFADDETLKRGSVTILGAAGKRLKELFDFVCVLDHECQLMANIPAAAPIATSLSSMLPELLGGGRSNISYNRSAAGSSSHYKGCKQYGIDFPDEALPFRKLHVLFGVTHNGEFWFKLEEHGLGDIFSISAHGVDFIKSVVYPIPKEVDLDLSRSPDALRAAIELVTGPTF
jgi:hypothetical protein